jgi:hypothetical protein
MFGGGKKMGMFINPFVVLTLFANLAVYVLHIVRKVMVLKGRDIDNDQLANFNVTTFYTSHIILIVANVLFAFLVFKNNTKLAIALITLGMFDMAILIYFSVLASKADGKEVLVPGADQFSKDYQKHTNALLATYSTSGFVALLSLFFVY